MLGNVKNFGKSQNTETLWKNVKTHRFEKRNMRERKKIERRPEIKPRDREKGVAPPEKSS